MEKSYFGQHDIVLARKAGFIINQIAVFFAACRALELGVESSTLRVVLEETGGNVREEIWPDIASSTVWQLTQFILLKPDEKWEPRPLKEEDDWDDSDHKMEVARVLLLKLDQFGTLKRLTMLAFLALGEDFLKVSLKFSSFDGCVGMAYIT